MWKWRCFRCYLWSELYAIQFDQMTFLCSNRHALYRKQLNRLLFILFLMQAKTRIIMLKVIKRHFDTKMEGKVDKREKIVTVMTKKPTKTKNKNKTKTKQKKKTNKQTNKETRPRHIASLQLIFWSDLYDNWDILNKFTHLLI